MNEDELGWIYFCGISSGLTVDILITFIPYCNKK